MTDRGPTRRVLIAAAHAFASAVAIPLAIPLATSLAAQTPGRAPAIAELGVGARSVSMGHAFEISSTDPDGIFHHPATLALARGVSLGWYAFPGSAGMISATAAAEWFGGGVGIGARALSYASPVGDVLPGGEDRVIAGGDHVVGELSASVGWGRSWSGVRLGAVGSLMQRRSGSDRDALGTLDLGIALPLGRAVVGLAAQNVTGQLLAGDYGTLTPQSITLGAGASGLPVGPLDLGGAASVGQRADGEVEIGGGVEVAWWPVTGRTFLGRFGYRRIPEGTALPWTAGAGFWGDALRLEYAYQGYRGGERTHRVTVGWRAGR
jgi:hypothetical protein